MTRRAFGLTLLVVVAGSACQSKAPLANSRPSAEQLAQDVLAALAQNDRAALETLALSEQEFRDHVWPELPAARPERNLPFSYVWKDLRQKSQYSLSSTLKKHGGQRYQLERVSFSDVTAYERNRIHRDATFHIRTSHGTAETIRVCGSMLEQGGAWKVFSYVVDE